MSEPTRLLRAALGYADLGWPVFPCAPRGKTPITRNGVKDATIDRAKIEAWWRATPLANIGLAMGGPSGAMALDIDVKKPTEDGDVSVAALIALHGDLPLTPSQRTGVYGERRGTQYLFRDFALARNTTGAAGGIAPGIDTRALGGYVLAAPSIHPSGAVYSWTHKPTQTPLAPAPDWLVQWFHKRGARAAEAAQALAVTTRPDWSQIPEAYVRAALDKEHGAIASCKEGGRNHALNKGAFNLGQLVGSGQVARALVEDVLVAAAIANGWAADEGMAAVEKVIRSGLEAGMREPRSPPARTMPARSPPAVRAVQAEAEAPANDVDEGGASGPMPAGPPPAAPAAAAGAAATAPAAVSDDWRDDLSVNGDGGVKRQSFLNAVLIIMNMPETRGLFARDEFRSAIVTTRRPPWALNGYTPGPVTDPDIAGARIWLETHNNQISKADTFNAIEYIADQHHVNPVRAYFDALVWDGVDRLDFWAIDYLGVDDAAFSRQAPAKWMIGAVARAMRPGCKVDTMLILEGEQGLKKSAALAALATLNDEAFFTDELGALGSKDAAQQLQGNLIVEMAELDALGRADVSAIKAFLTRQVDKIRLPYARTVSALPRSCVFAGTVNPNGAGYLRDPTGGRRFWPVACTKVDLEGLVAARDQLWAEAVARYRAGEQWWLTDEVVLAEARQAQQDRAEVDPLHDKLAAYLRDKTRTTTHEVIADAWGLASRDATPGMAQRAAAALRREGWARKKVKRRDGTTQWVYYDPACLTEWTTQRTRPGGEADA